MIETHSEYLLLKLKSLVRNGQLKPDDIIINYVSKSDNGAKIQHIKLNEHGRFTSKWPDNLLDYSYFGMT